MKDIFTDFYNKVLSFFNRTEQSGENAKDVACNRLKLVLMQDRTNLTPAIMDRMRKELIELLSKYMELDRELLDLNFEHEEEQIALMLSIPVIRAKDENEINAILDKEDEEKRKIKLLLEEDLDDDFEEEDDDDTDEEDVESELDNDSEEVDSNEAKKDVKTKKELKKEKFFKEKKNGESLNNTNDNEADSIENDIEDELEETENETSEETKDLEQVTEEG